MRVGADSKLKKGGAFLNEFNKLFNTFTVAAVVVMLITTVVAASITVINRGDGNIFSATSGKKQVEITEICVTKL